MRRIIALAKFSLLIAGWPSVTKASERTPEVETAVDRLIEMAEAAKDEIVKRSPKPEDWGDLHLTEYDPDYRGSGLPAFTFVDRSTVKVREPGKITYTDLEFVLEGTSVVFLQSRFRGMITSRAEDADFIKAVSDFADFSHPVSFYIEQAKTDILQTEGDRIPKGAADLQLAGIRFEYFDRPQVIKVTFHQVSTIKGTQSSQSSRAFDRRLRPDGVVVTENE